MSTATRRRSVGTVRWVNSEIRRLVDRANSQAQSLGAGTPNAGHFVCPICLSLQPFARATRGHYPAKALPGTHAMEVLCAPCNAFIGHAYEAEALRVLAGTTQVMVSSEGTGRVSTTARVVTSNKTVNIHVDGEKNRRFPEQFRRIQENSSRPWEMRFQLHQPDETAARRAILAWSLLAWFRFAGYRYLASAGAHLVRRLVLDPAATLPPTCWMAPQPRFEPATPSPVLIARAEGRPAALDEVDELLGVGIRWGAGLAIMPFANDATGQIWERVLALKSENRLREIITAPLRSLLKDGRLEKGLPGDVVFSVPATGARYVLAGGLDAAESQALLLGLSPYLIERRPESRERR